MGFRFRKSVKAGPLRINFSKSGVGASIGNKYCRYTKKAGGGTRSTVTLPGTGISYVEDHKSRSSTQTPNRSSGGSSSAGSEHPANPVIELLLCLFLGWMGAHRFYKRQFFMGWLYVFTLGCFGIGWLGDLLVMVASFFTGTSFHGKKFSKPVAYLLACALIMIPAGCRNEASDIATDPTTLTAATEITQAATQPDPSTLPETTHPEATTTAPETFEPTTEAAERETGSVPETSEAVVVPPITEAPTTPTETDPPVVPEETETHTEAAETEPPVQTEAPIVTEAPTVPVTEEKTHQYVLNTSTMKFHEPHCRDVNKIKPENREDYTGTREDLIAQGYKPCGHCHP